jgi:hypothetical protein
MRIGDKVRYIAINHPSGCALPTTGTIIRIWDDKRVQIRWDEMRGGWVNISTEAPKNYRLLHEQLLIPFSVEHV